MSGTERMAATKTRSKGIVSWPQEERPRERLLSRGAQALTDAELVAILVRVGFKGTSAVELGRQLLKRFGSLRAMVEAPVIALLGRGLRRLTAGGRRPNSHGVQPRCLVRGIKHLVNEILEIERRLTSTVDAVSPYNFELHT